MAPMVFTALILTLYVYKSAMLILFQNKILYMPSMPPFARSERIADYAAACNPVSWREERIRAADGTELALAVGKFDGQEEENEGSRGVKRNGKQEATEKTGKKTHVVTIYFQGNGSSLPPRLPALSSVLKLLHQDPPHQSPPTQHTLLALSYRGFWTSHGRPSEAGIGLDAAAALAHARRAFPSRPDSETRIVLWGQSLGAGVAATAAATASAEARDAEGTSKEKEIEIQGLILETPFTSVRSMLSTLYPQKWLPYRYLGPFLRNHWDSEAALRSMGDCSHHHHPPPNIIATTSPTSTPTPNPPLPKILILQAGKDELVPATHGVELDRICREELGMDVRRVEVRGALHTEVMGKGAGRGEVVEFLRRIASG